jgi:hypothetical protein
VAFGTAASLVERLGRLHDDLGLDGIVAELTMEPALRTLRILTHEVMPALR